MTPYISAAQFELTCAYKTRRDTAREVEAALATDFIDSTSFAAWQAAVKRVELWKSIHAWLTDGKSVTELFAAQRSSWTSAAMRAQEYGQETVASVYVRTLDILEAWAVNETK